MSSTKRGSTRNESDFYSTPPWVTHRLFDVGALGEGLVLPSGKWLEPCAGDGELIRAVNEKHRDIFWSANEIREEMRDVLIPHVQGIVSIGDFTELHPQTWEGFLPFDVSITNPPFSLAMPIIRKSLLVAKTTVMLLRLNFWGSGDRQPFLQENPPDTFVLPNRPVFSLNKFGKPGTDSPEYAWFVWGEYANGQKTTGRIRVLNQTPKAERKVWTEHVKRMALTSPLLVEALSVEQALSSLPAG